MKSNIAAICGELKKLNTELEEKKVKASLREEEKKKAKARQQEHNSEEDLDLGL